MTTFKIFFNDQDIRRITLSNIATWEAFQAHLLELYSEQYHPELSIRYVDEEGDSISITCQREWESMLEAMAGQPLIKLSIAEGTNSGQYFKDGPPPETKEVYVTNEENAKVVIQPDEKMRTLSIQIPDCLERLVPGGRILPTNIPSWLERCIEVKKVPGPVPTLDLDIDVCELFDALHEEAVSRIGPEKERSVMEKAKEFLSSMLDIVPTHPLAHYNLACVHSLLGDVKEGIESLRRAIHGGYSNLKHMIEDADLANLRNTCHQEFMELVEMLRSDRTEAEKGEEPAEKPIVFDEVMDCNDDFVVIGEETTEVEEKVAEPAPQAVEVKITEAQPVPVEAKNEQPVVEVKSQPATQWAKQQEALATMGFVNTDVNEVLLNDFKGDLVKVVNALLSQ